MLTTKHLKASKKYEVPDEGGVSRIANYSSTLSKGFSWDRLSDDEEVVQEMGVYYETPGGVWKFWEITWNAKVSKDEEEYKSLTSKSKSHLSGLNFQMPTKPKAPTSLGMYPDPGIDEHYTPK